MDFSLRINLLTIWLLIVARIATGQQYNCILKFDDNTVVGSDEWDTSIDLTGRMGDDLLDNYGVNRDFFTFKAENIKSARIYASNSSLSKYDKYFSVTLDSTNVLHLSTSSEYKKIEEVLTTLNVEFSVSFECATGTKVTSFQVKLKDSNNNPPTFSETHYEFKDVPMPLAVNINLLPMLYQINVVDLDISSQGVEMSLDQTGAEYFSASATRIGTSKEYSVTLKIIKKLELSEPMTFKLTATDRGTANDPSRLPTEVSVTLEPNVGESVYEPKFVEPLYTAKIAEAKGVISFLEGDIKLQGLGEGDIQFTLSDPLRNFDYSSYIKCESKSDNVLCSWNEEKDSDELLEQPYALIKMKGKQASYNEDYTIIHLALPGPPPPTTTTSTTTTETTSPPCTTETTTICPECPSTVTVTECDCTTASVTFDPTTMCPTSTDNGPSTTLSTGTAEGTTCPTFDPTTMCPSSTDSGDNGSSTTPSTGSTEVCTCPSCDPTTMCPSSTDSGDNGSSTTPSTGSTEVCTCPSCDPTTMCPSSTDSGDNGSSTTPSTGSTEVCSCPSFDPTTMCPQATTTEGNSCITECPSTETTGKATTNDHTTPNDECCDCSSCLSNDTTTPQIPSSSSFPGSSTTEDNCECSTLASSTEMSSTTPSYPSSSSTDSGSITSITSSSTATSSTDTGSATSSSSTDSGSITSITSSSTATSSTDTGSSTSSSSTDSGSASSTTSSSTATSSTDSGSSTSASSTDSGSITSITSSSTATSSTDSGSSNSSSSTDSDGTTSTPQGSTVCPVCPTTCPDGTTEWSSTSSTGTPEPLTKPEFSEREYEFTIYSPIKNIVLLEPKLKKEVKNVEFSITYGEETEVNWLDIDKGTGAVKLTNYPSVGEHTFQLEAVIPGTALKDTVPLIIVVSSGQVCDNSTFVFQARYQLVKVPENKITTILPALENTEAGSCTFTFETDIGSTADYFIADGTTGRITVKSLDREADEFKNAAEPTIRLTVNATCGDHEKEQSRRSVRSSGDYVGGLPRLEFVETISNQKSIMDIVVLVQDENDNPPVFNPKSITVGYPTRELSEVLQPPSLATVQATDADIGENAVITYSLQAGEEDNNHFWIHPTTGVIYPRQGDFDDDDDMKIKVSAKDRAGNAANPKLTLTVRPLKKEHVFEVMVAGAVLENVNSIVENISKTSGLDVRVLTSAVVSGTSPSKSRSRRATLRDENSPTALRLVLYALEKDKPIGLDDFKKKLGNNNEGWQVREIQTTNKGSHGEDTSGYLAAVITLAVLLVLILGGAGVAAYIFIIRPRMKKTADYDRFRRESKDGTESNLSSVVPTIPPLTEDILKKKYDADVSSSPVPVDGSLTERQYENISDHYETTDWATSQETLPRQPETSEWGSLDVSLPRQTETQSTVQTPADYLLAPPEIPPARKRSLTLYADDDLEENSERRDESNDDYDVPDESAVEKANRRKSVVTFNENVDTIEIERL